MKVAIERVRGSYKHNDINDYGELKDFLIKHYKTFYITTEQGYKYFCVEIEKKDLGKLMLDILDDTEVENNTSELIFDTRYFAYTKGFEDYYCLVIYDDFQE